MESSAPKGLHLDWSWCGQSASGNADKGSFHNQGEQKRAGYKNVIVPTGNWLAGPQDFVNKTLFLPSCPLLYEAPSILKPSPLLPTPHQLWVKQAFSKVFPPLAGYQVWYRKHSGGPSTRPLVVSYPKDKATSARREGRRSPWNGQIQEDFLEKVRVQLGLKDKK